VDCDWLVIFRGFAGEGSTKAVGQFRAEECLQKLKEERANLGLRRNVKDLVILITFFAMIVQPAIAALNVFAEKNRF